MQWRRWGSNPRPLGPCITLPSRSLKTECAALCVCRWSCWIWTQVRSWCSILTAGSQWTKMTIRSVGRCQLSRKVLPPFLVSSFYGVDCFVALHPSQQFFSHVGMILCLPGFKQVLSWGKSALLKDTTQCLRSVSNPWPFNLQANKLPLSHHTPNFLWFVWVNNVSVLFRHLSGLKQYIHIWAPVFRVSDWVRIKQTCSAIEI